MKKMLLIILLAVSACTTHQTRTDVVAQIPNIKRDDAFDLALRAMMQSGFTIISATKDAGLFVATRGANHLLTWQNPAINVVVTKNGNGVTLNAGSTVGGQLIDYGTTQDTLEDFCKSLLANSKNATCKIQ